MKKTFKHILLAGHGVKLFLWSETARHVNARCVRAG